MYSARRNHNPQHPRTILFDILVDGLANGWIIKRETKGFAVYDETNTCKGDEFAGVGEALDYAQTGEREPRNEETNVRT